MFLAELNSLFLPEKRMDLELVYSWLDLRVLEKILQVVFEIVTNSNILHFAFFFQLNQCFPSLPSYNSVLFTLGIYFTNSWPVNDQQIQISTIQSFQNLIASCDSLIVSLLSWRYLTCYEDFTPIDLHVFEYSSNFHFVLVDTGSIDMSIARFQSPSNSIQTLLPFKLIRAISNAGDCIARIQHFPTWIRLFLHIIYQQCCSNSYEPASRETVHCSETSKESQFIRCIDGNSCDWQQQGNGWELSPFWRKQR